MTLTATRTVEMLLPELSLISSPDLRDLVVRSHIAAMTNSEWSDLEAVPYIDSHTSKSLAPMTYLSHIRWVARAVDAMIKSLNDSPDFSLDADTAVAGSLLHDVGLMFEFQLNSDGSFAMRHPDMPIRHPALGMQIVLSEGGNRAVAHIVATHSYEGDRVQRSPEAVVVRHCDVVSYDLARRVALDPPLSPR